MEKTEMRDRMDALLKQMKLTAKEIRLQIKGLKKKDRETAEYKSRVERATELQKRFSAEVAEYNEISGQYYNK